MSSLKTLHHAQQSSGCRPEKLGSALPDSNIFFTRYSIYLAWEVSPEPGEENIIHNSEASHNAVRKSCYSTLQAAYSR